MQTKCSFMPPRCLEVCTIQTSQKLRRSWSPDGNLTPCKVQALLSRTLATQQLILMISGQGLEHSILQVNHLQIFWLYIFLLKASALYTSGKLATLRIQRKCVCRLVLVDSKSLILISTQNPPFRLSTRRC